MLYSTPPAGALEQSSQSPTAPWDSWTLPWGWANGTGSSSQRGPKPQAPTGCSAPPEKQGSRKGPTSQVMLEAERTQPGSRPQLLISSLPSCGGLSSNWLLYPELTILVTHWNGCSQCRNSYRRRPNRLSHLPWAPLVLTHWLPIGQQLWLRKQGELSPPQRKCASIIYILLGPKLARGRAGFPCLPKPGSVNLAASESLRGVSPLPLNTKGQGAKRKKTRRC